jgi:hypothetical protein
MGFASLLAGLLPLRQKLPQLRAVNQEWLHVVNFP